MNSISFVNQNVMLYYVCFLKARAKKVFSNFMIIVIDELTSLINLKGITCYNNYNGKPCKVIYLFIEHTNYIYSR